MNPAHLMRLSCQKLCVPSPLASKAHFFLGHMITWYEYDFDLCFLPSVSRPPHYKNIFARFRFLLPSPLLSFWILIIFTECIDSCHFSSNTWGYADTLLWKSNIKCSFPMLVSVLYILCFQNFHCTCILFSDCSYYYGFLLPFLFLSKKIPV